MSEKTSARSLAHSWRGQRFFQVGPHLDPSSLTVGSHVTPQVDPRSLILTNRDTVSPFPYIVLSGSRTRRAPTGQRPQDCLRIVSPDVRVGELLLVGRRHFRPTTVGCF